MTAQQLRDMLDDMIGASPDTASKEVVFGLDKQPIATGGDFEKLVLLERIEDGPKVAFEDYSFLE